MRLRILRDRRAARRLPLRMMTFGLLLACGAGVEARAQSGRRVPRTSAGPTPAATPAETPAPEAPKAETRSLPKFAVVVAGRLASGSGDERARVILASFLKRLKDAPNVTASYAGEMKRDEAERRARAESESFVVLLETETDRVQDGRLILSTPDLVVKYQLFEPATGRSKTKGKVYFQPAGGARARKDRWPDGPPIKMTPEAAGIEAAELLLHWLNNHRPEEKPAAGSVRIH